ncbi:MAG: ABC transporter ATP-binding protein [Myxococcales bacterium]|nr:ABC transporter ATP-binding protein [Myxococcales bacterium]
MPLALERVSFAYGARSVLAEVTFALGNGELVCVAGGNGAGKTTLLRVAAGLLQPTAGTARVADLDPARAPRARLARRLAYVPQEHAQVFPFTVHEIVLMGRYAYAARFALEDDSDVDAARAAMARCDVLALAERRFSELSGGERRRTLLAQAFAQQTELVLLDEPTASLDPLHASRIFATLRDETRTRGTAALVATHDLHLAARHADRLLLLADGALVADGPPDDVLRSPAAERAFGVPFHVGTLPDGGRFVVPRT